MSIDFPIQVKAINWGDTPVLYEKPILIDASPGDFVAVRPVQNNPENTTYLGVMLGAVALGTHVQHDRETGVLTIDKTGHNPMMWVPELNRVVFGMESWWGHIKDPAHLEEITDATIQNTWYVQALYQLSESDNESK